MLDRFTMPLTHRPLQRLARPLHRHHITPDQVTFTAFLIGITALPLLAYEQYGWALQYASEALKGDTDCRRLLMEKKGGGTMTESPL